MILVDTDIMIDILREYLPAKAWLTSLGTHPMLLPGFVVMELLQGCRNTTEQHTLMKTLTPYRHVWPSESTCEQALSVLSSFTLVMDWACLMLLSGKQLYRLVYRCTPSIENTMR